MYEHIRYRRGVVAALVLFGVCVWFRSHHAHGVAARPTKLARPNFDAPRVDVSRIEPAPIASVSKIEVHRSKFERYVWEAFPAWQQENPGRQCPDSIDELNKYIGAVDSLDESGQQIQAVCGPTLTATDRRFGIVFNVRVAGADGVFGTDDDGYPF